MQLWLAGRRADVVILDQVRISARTPSQDEPTRRRLVPRTPKVSGRWRSLLERRPGCCTLELTM